MMIAVVFLMLATPAPRAQATPLAILEIIKAGVKKVIKAMDLKIQRLQNKTIWLQNAQKVLENNMSKLKLREIADWTEKQRKLYSDYYEELKKVKDVIAAYQGVKNIMTKQLRMVEEYKRAYNLFSGSGHFSPQELEYMGRVYSGMLEASARNLDELLLVVNSFATQMSDAKRLELISKASGSMDEQLADLRRFNSQQLKLGLQRAKEKNDRLTIKQIYGIQQ